MSASPDDGYIALAQAIITSATENYKYTLIALKNGCRRNGIFKHKEELEEFFLSDWFKLLSNLDGKVLIEKMWEDWYFDR